MVTKLSKITIMAFVLLMHVGCLKMSSDSGGSGGAGVTDTTVSAPASQGPIGGVFNLNPSLTVSAKKYADIDYDRIIIKSTKPGGGSSSYSRSVLGDSRLAKIPISVDHSYVVILKKGSSTVFQERLK